MISASIYIHKNEGNSTYYVRRREVHLEDRLAAPFVFDCV